ncbi:glutamine-hydrolyzing GMP synthase [Brockia lithotrophica]|uniref:GMP synthase (glutamine-hydrolyzing) n=1 Tax=Brockia lithotrophica TaxID=933949 RepID=A0A660KUU2_9BACL|nr:glutamine-hydrolyzing GMP synthase [Brockia lithotrophica]RKQ84753.1 GMP synthase (glutamine-hydrolysing) B subunit [Brockia lithotrophica]
MSLVTCRFRPWVLVFTADERLLRRLRRAGIYAELPLPGERDDLPAALVLPRTEEGFWTPEERELFFRFRTAGVPVLWEEGAAPPDGETFLSGTRENAFVSFSDDEGFSQLLAALRELVGGGPAYTPIAFAERCVAELAAHLGEGRAVVALSGGLDSAVSAALVARALGDRLVPLFVDHGLLRAGEAEEVPAALTQILGLPVRRVDARDAFLAALRGLVDPEAKRRAVGETFICVFEREVAGIPDVAYLVQGTVYSDLIESVGRGGVKAHHNVGGLPERVSFTLVEPLRPLLKDEVREIARHLGFPASLVERQPFPGPGLAVRVVGEVTAERLELLREADRIVREEIGSSDVAPTLWQYFAVLPGVRTVGAKDGRRREGEVVAVRAVVSEEAMSARAAELPYELLRKIAHRLTTELPAVARVVYDVTDKPPATIEWE